MGRKHYSQFVLLGFLMVLFIGSVMLINFTPRDSSSISTSMTNSIGSCTSTDTSNPEHLYNETTLLEYYNDSSPYYYITESTYPYNYSVVWVQPISPEDDFDLYLYSNTQYSYLRASSTRENGELDWIVFHPGYSDYYPLIDTYTGEGNAYIQWEESSNYEIDTTASGSLNVSNCAEIYQVSLSNNLLYNFSLEVPGTGDFGLYIYYVSHYYAVSGSSYAKSSSGGLNGTTEEIMNFHPSYSSDYAIVVVRQSGNGTFYLNSTISGSATAYLADDNLVTGTYSPLIPSYNYRTAVASATYYHAVWMKPGTLDSYDLHLYNDSNYQNLMTSSINSGDSLDCVIFRPSSSQYFYPCINYSGASSGSAYVEWEDSSSSLSIDYNKYMYFWGSDHLEVYQVSLSSTQAYTFKLEVLYNDPIDGDLYLFYLNPGGATNLSGCVIKSTTSGIGIDEEISNFSPPITGEYAVIVVCAAGSGDLYLSYDYYAPPWFFDPVILTAIIIGVILAIIPISWAIYNKLRTQQQNQRERVHLNRRMRRQQQQLQRQRWPSVQPRPPITPPPLTTSVTFKFCPACNAKNEANKYFCRDCGAEL